MDAVLQRLMAGLPPEAAQKADQVWKMLDDMAENDPQSYKAFIEQQTREAAPTVSDSISAGPARAALIVNAAFEAASQAQTPGPQLGVTKADIRKIIDSSPDQQAEPSSAVIAIFQSDNVPPATVQGKHLAQSRAQDLKFMQLPLKMRREPFRVPAKGGERMVYELNVHSGTAECAARDQPHGSRHHLVERATRFVERLFKVSVSRNRRSLMVARDVADADEVRRVEENHSASALHKAAHGTAAESLPDALLQQLVGLGAADASAHRTPTASKALRPLIQEIHGDGTIRDEARQQETSEGCAGNRLPDEADPRAATALASAPHTCTPCTCVSTPNRSASAGDSTAPALQMVSGAVPLANYPDAPVQLESTFESSDAGITIRVALPIGMRAADVEVYGEEDTVIVCAPGCEEIRVKCGDCDVRSVQARMARGGLLTIVCPNFDS